MPYKDAEGRRQAYQRKSEAAGTRRKSHGPAPICRSCGTPCPQTPAAWKTLASLDIEGSTYLCIDCRQALPELLDSPSALQSWLASVGRDLGVEGVTYKLPHGWQLIRRFLTNANAIPTEAELAVLLEAFGANVATTMLLTKENDRLRAADRKRRSDNHAAMVTRQTGAYSADATARRAAALATRPSESADTPLGQVLLCLSQAAYDYRHKGESTLSKEAGLNENTLRAARGRGSADFDTLKDLAAMFFGNVPVEVVTEIIRKADLHANPSVAGLQAAIEVLRDRSQDGKHHGPAVGTFPEVLPGNPPRKRGGRKKGTIRSEAELIKQSSVNKERWAGLPDDARASQVALMRAGRNKLRNVVRRALRARLRSNPHPSPSIVKKWAVDVAARIDELGDAGAVLALWKPELKGRGITGGGRGRSADTDHHLRICETKRDEPALSWKILYARLNSLPADKVKRSQWVSLSNGHWQWHDSNHIADCAPRKR